MKKPPTYPPESQLRILAAQLATHAKVPTDNVPEFCERVCNTVLRVRNRDRRATGERPGPALLEAADAARKLQKAFFRLKNEDLEWVEKIKPSSTPFMAGEIKRLSSTILNLSILFNEAVGRQAPIPRYLVRDSVRRPKVKDQMLREFVFDLLNAAVETGGALDFNQNSVSGRLAYALDKLRKYVPPGLIEDPLPARRIQRLKTEHGSDA